MFVSKVQIGTAFCQQLHNVQMTVCRCDVDRRLPEDLRKYQLELVALRSLHCAIRDVGGTSITYIIVMNVSSIVKQYLGGLCIPDCAHLVQGPWNWSTHCRVGAYYRDLLCDSLSSLSTSAPLSRNARSIPKDTSTELYMSLCNGVSPNESGTLMSPCAFNRI